MFRERIEQELKENTQLRTYIRKLAKCSGRSYPIQTVDGDMAPRLMGHRGYPVKKNKLGNLYIPVSGPIAGYYAHSTRRIEVGCDWLLELLISRKHMKVKNGEAKEDRTA